MTKIFDPENCNKCLEEFFCSYWKSKKGASVKADFLCGGVEKKNSK